MSTAETLQEALALSRSGDVEGAITLLRGAMADGPSTDALRSLMFSLLSSKERFREAIDVCSASLAEELAPLPKSNWTLRRGLLWIEVGERKAAIVDLLEVQKLKANEGHAEQARAALLRVATMKK